MEQQRALTVTQLEAHPLCDEPEFAALVEGLVKDAAPRVFALVEEQGEREDGWVFAWGIAFEDHAYVVREGGGLAQCHPSAESAYERYSAKWKIRLVWCGPVAVDAA